MKKIKSRYVGSTICCSLALLLNISISHAADNFPNGYKAPNGAISVTKYGAKAGDNKSDSKAFQTAINSAGKKVVYVPKGVYIFDKSVELKEGTKIYMHKDAVIKSKINSKVSVMFTNFPMNTKKAKGASNIIIKGGTIDMNGVLDKSGKSKYLPNAVSSNGIALGYAKNITIEGVVFKNNFNAHSIQLADITKAKIKNCKFTGYYNDDRRKDNIKEAIQIESGVKFGLPYVKAETRKSSQDITIDGCIFDKNIQVGVGNHYQIAESKVKNVTIKNNQFKNMQVAAIRFAGWENVKIENNKIWVSNHKYTGSRYAIKLYGASTVLDKKDNNKVLVASLSKNISIKNNAISITIPNIPAISITGSTKSNNKHKNITLYDNYIDFKNVTGKEHIYLNKIDGANLKYNRCMGNGKYLRYTSSSKINVKSTLTVRFKELKTEKEIAKPVISHDVGFGSKKANAKNISGYKLKSPSAKYVTLTKERAARTITFWYEKKK